MAAAGERHWWYVSTRQLLSDLIGPHLAPVTGSTRYLDAAGGSGATGSWLAARATTLVDDVDEASVRYASSITGYRPVVADLNALPHADGRFDAVLCVTALCHRMNTDPGGDGARAGARHETGRSGCPDGAGRAAACAVATIASRTRLGASIAPRSPDCSSGAGLAVVRATGAYTFLVPPAAVLAVLERGRSTSDVGRNESGFGGVLPVLARIERSLLRRIDLPTGLSVIAIASKPG